MNSKTFSRFDPSRVPSPCFVIDEVAVEENLKVLRRVQDDSGARVLAALKAFSCWSLGSLTSRYLSGVCASGLHEARLGKDEYCCNRNALGDEANGELHVFSAAYSEADLREILDIADHVVFNSFSQWQRFQPLLIRAQEKRPQLKYGLRVNPEHSEGEVAIYDPCAPGSRLGIPSSQFQGQDLQGISGLHFHTLCEQGLDPLKRTLAVIEKKFGQLLPEMQWINFGGGHHISHPDYDVEGLIELIKDFSNRYDIQVYLEPGEAVAIHTGVMVAEVLDLIWNQCDQAILDTSATCHMPDTLEMPYRADIFGAGKLDEKAYNYRLGGMTCLAGDVIGDYSFEQPLVPGQRLMFDDMSHYTMVKTTTFNGIGLPAIAIWNSRSDEVRIVKQFGYEDFRSRLS
ncbi:carboxynorspermidine decarboxylase [Motiliproteus sp. MSK22-1]|uniref:carboxynorspermidine decarboxylase n=1 Tax=Motiliproteus sp. MSK22-1 TaxID=1897630 RepID=UPI000978A8EE|nr:carboxynorspermidine decarboxylase [Motiliproteus sp. MSK22-1]OMH31875.1 carboxynorspermidine decarboxylase [Motiliproteus sp. MSK22-1]